MERYNLIRIVSIGVLVLTIGGVAWWYFATTSGGIQKILQKEEQSQNGTTGKNIGDKKGFKILWHIGTQVEPLADTAPSATGEISSEIKNLKERVDGYYFLVVSGGNIAYWPGRPERCAFNRKRTDDPKATITIENVSYTETDLAAQCEKLQSAYLTSVQSSRAKYKSLPLRTIGALIHQDAMERVVQNLGIKAEQEKGKLIMSEMILRDKDFSYSESSDALTLESLPKSIDLLNSQGVPVQNVLAYQEPTVQSGNDSVVSVPGTPGGKKIVRLPDNIRMIDMIGKAFQKYGFPLSQFSPNVRVWKDSFPGLFGGAKSSPFLGGVGFEGGTSSFVKEVAGESKIDNFSEGVSWLLENTDEKIFFLMPGYWSDADINTGETRAGLIQRLELYIKTFDTNIRKNTNGKYSICNERIYLIPASYGSPMHAQTFPIEEGGHLAGTVGGEIVALDNLRKEMCH